MDWAFRMMQELKASNTGHFITLTYAPEHIPYVWEDDNAIGYTLDKHDLWKFHKAIRNSQKRLLKKEAKNWKQRYFSVGEYGDGGRPHYHSIMYNTHPETIDKLMEGKIWNKGIIDIGDVTPASVAYVAKYIIDSEWKKGDPRQRPFNVMSRRPGIGHNYLEGNRKWHREINSFNHDEYRMYIMNNGQKQRMPRYYKDRIFKETDELLKPLMEDSMELFYIELEMEMRKQAAEEYNRIAKLGANPEIYIKEKIDYAYQQVRIKSKKQNSL